jgi:hypothetical protein
MGFPILPSNVYLLLKPGRLDYIMLPSFHQVDTVWSFRTLFSDAPEVTLFPPWAGRRSPTKIIIGLIIKYV